MNRLKITILALTASLSINQLIAQDFSFGGKAGLNYSSLSGDNDSNGLGFHLGGLMNVGLSDALNFRLELLASSRRMAFSETSELLNVKTKISGSASPLYIAIPIMYKYNVNDKISLMAGPQISFLATNKSSVTTTTTVGSLDPVKTKSTSNSKTGYRSSEFGFALGGEYNLSENLGMGLRYVRALQSRTDLTNADDNFNVIQLSALYNF